MSRKKRTITKKTLTTEILTVFRRQPKKSFNYKQLAKIIGFNKDEVGKLINNILFELLEQEKILEVSRGKYRLKIIRNLLDGIIDINSSGNAYVVVDGFDQDIFINKKYIKNVVSGDLVNIALHSKFKKNKLEGELIEVIEHRTHQFVGIVELSKHCAFVISTNPKIPFDIYLPNSECKNIKEGQKVVCEVTNWGNSKNNPTGKLINILGYPGEHNVEIHSILAEFNLPIKFDLSIEELAKKIPAKISNKEVKKRRDFRNTTTFTIDPEDAKDFDDALSIKKIDNYWEIGIHIADVSHYIKENDLIDLEAKERATSVYLIDRVIPMLPEILSNKLCSLRPKEEKLCFSAVFNIDENGKILNEWFGKTIINSNHRFTYQEAQNIIINKEGLFTKELEILNKIAQILRSKRMKSGAFSFERSETKFKLDKEGNPITIYYKKSEEAHKLIEEFMLLANRKVAEFIAKQNKTFVYRIHDSPDPEKLETFNIFLKTFGYSIQTENKKSIASSMNSLLKDIQERRESNMIETLAIRTMAKATYSIDNIGHYGLAFDYYSHFTSPIRRYPDVLVHRLLHFYLEKGIHSPYKNLENQCKHCSEKEIIASKAERASIKYMQAKYMSDKIGEIFNGVISGITDFGIFVEVQNTGCEGLIKLRDIPGDFYVYKEKEFCVEGFQTKKRFYIGTELKVKIRKVSLEKKEIDMILL